MTDEIDFYRSAKILIDHHGDDAESVATQRAEAFKSKGSLDGHGVWTQIGDAIKELQRSERVDSEALN